MSANKDRRVEPFAIAALLCETNPPPRILVVEDDDDIRMLNTEALLHSGYRVDAAEDGAVAWEALQLNDYDLLITDNQMPNVSGVELLYKIHAARIKLPTILVTGAPPTEELKRHPWMKVEAMLLKPFTFEEFLTTVKGILHRVQGHAAKPATSSPYQQNQPPSAGWQPG
jgi:DNA-binding response OmpR family regulator